MIILSILKILAVIIGIITTLALLIIGFAKKDQTKLKKAGIVFLATWVIAIVITVFQFAFHKL